MKKKIAILGGGMASLSAAYELSDYPGWQDQYEITIYQLGWRLGGKTTTGRGPHDRIEEHGIHILQGWYDTTFRLLRAVYEERQQKGLDPGSPLQDLFEDGLNRNNTTLLTQFDPRQGKWVSWPLIFPETKELPGDSGPQPVWELMQKGLAILLEFVLGSPYQKHINPISKWILDHFFPADGKSNDGCLAFLARPLTKAVDRAEENLPELYKLLVRAFHLSHEPTDRPHEHHRRILLHLEKFIKGVEDGLLGALEKALHLQRLVLALKFGYYMLKGILEDVYDPDTEQFNFKAIDQYDFREWLSRQGAPDWVVHSVLVRFFYTGTFSDLVNDQGGAIAAGTAVQFLLHSVGYKGSFVFQFRYGTGDTMVMPLYQVLKARGINFKFFQKINQVNYDPGGSIEKIDLARQVDLSVPEYDPVYSTFDQIKAWPSAPLYDQINPAQAAKLRADNIDLEDPWANWQDVEEYSLNRGVDFDEVILGIPVGTLKTICSSIVDQVDAWKQMTTQVKTTPTQSAQLWLLPTLADLGFDPADWGLPPVNGAANVVVYQNPMYSWLDSSLVLPNENWPADNKPQFLAYYTGAYVLEAPLPPFSDHAYPALQLGYLKRTFRQWLHDNMAFFWPDVTSIPYPTGLDFSHLVGQHTDDSPQEKYESQYFRINVRPSDHYTLSVPKSGQHRLKTDASGFDNLFLCGDWIDFGINVGYIDGAIQSGLQAGQALRTKLGLGGHKELWGRLRD